MVKKSERFPSRHRLTLEHSGTFSGVAISGLTYSGVSVDMSTNGLRVRLKASLVVPLGTPVIVCLAPDLPNVDDDDPIIFEAKIVWRRASEVGLLITEMSHHTSEIYCDLLHY